MNYQNFYGLQKEPFSQGIKINDLYPLPDLSALVTRFKYCTNLRAVGIITGEIGSGKSTSLRFACSELHPSEFKIIPLVAHSGTLMEFLKQCCIQLGETQLSPSITKLLKTFRDLLLEIALKNMSPVLIIDEAHLMRDEIFAQLHTLSQYEFDSKPVLSIILCGQTYLLDKLNSIASRAFASRVVGRTHLESLDLEHMRGYIKHHLEITGIKEQLFTEESILAIHQGSGGLLRRANILARGALIAAASENKKMVSPENVRIAATEIL